MLVLDTPKANQIRKEIAIVDQQILPIIIMVRKQVSVLEPQLKCYCG